MAATLRLLRGPLPCRFIFNRASRIFTFQIHRQSFHAQQVKKQHTVLNYKSDCLQNHAVGNSIVSSSRWIHSTSSLNGELVQFKLADIGEGIAEVQVTEWYVQVGDKVEQFDQICEVKSDKASVTITSRYAGTVKKLYYEVDEEARVGQPLVDIEIEGEASEPVTTEPEQVNTESSAAAALPPIPSQEPAAVLDPPIAVSPLLPSGKRRIVPATPSVRKIAKENEIDLSDVPATGKDGRVLKEDILSYLQDGPEISVQQRQQAVKVPVFVAGEDEVIPLKGIRKAMAKSMESSLQIPHFGYYDEIDVTQLKSVRKSLNKGVCKQRDMKMSYMPFFLKAASMALLQYPIINSSLDEDKTNLIYKKSHNIGIAMDTKDGLLVPNVKDVQTKSVFEISEDLTRLQKLGFEGKLKLEDLTGGTFTLSNIGSIGGTYTKPVISPPEVAIGALGKVQTLPRFDKDGAVVAANILTISWSADHRVLDGATMARFSNVWKSYLENPSTMILDLK